MKTIDFTSSMWGHAFHRDTFREIEAGGIVVRWLDKFKNRRRYSVMVHSSDHPSVGDKVRLKTQGGIQEPTIYDFDWCHDPRDMYTLYLVFDDKSLVEKAA